MKFDKALALGAYAFQAFATLGLVFGVSHMLPAGEYGQYSLVVATAQSAAVLAFEWIRLAAVRFCSGSEGDEVATRLATVQATFAAACGALVVVGAGVAMWQTQLQVSVSLGLVVALLMGATDLQLIFLRSRGSFLQFAGLQCSRSMALLVASIGAAWATQSTEGALLGLAGGYAVSLILFVLADPAWWRWKLSLARKRVFKDMAAYGISAAAASMVYLQVPLLLRWVAKSVLGVDAFAGFSLTMDILQKPFALVTSAIGGILTPGIIAEFEQSSDPRSPKLRQLYEAQMWSVFLLLGGSIAFLPEMCALVVRPSLHAAVLACGPAVAIIFAGHTLVQTTISIPGHLLQLGRMLIGNAVAELALITLAAAPGTQLAVLQPYGWLWCCAVAVLLAIAVGIPLVKRVACERPTATLVVGTTCCAALSALHFWSTKGQWFSMGLKATSAALITAALLLLYRQVDQRINLRNAT